MAFLFSKKNQKKKTKAKVIPIDIKRRQYNNLNNRHQISRNNDLIYTEPLKMETPYSNRKNTYKKKKKINKYFYRQLAVLSVLVVITFAIIFGLFKFFTRKNATEVFIDEVPLGIIKSKTIKAEDLKNTAVAQLEKEKNVKLQSPEKITVKPVHAGRGALTEDYIITQIKSKLTYKIEACSIIVEGVNRAIVKNEDEANEIKKELINQYITEDSSEIVEEESGFVESFVLDKLYVDEEEILSKEKVTELLKSTTSEPQSYTVQRGDSLSKIAVKVSMTLDELYKENPTLTPDTIIREGDTLQITVKKPMLSVRTVELEKTKEPLERTTEYQDDNTQNKGYTKVIQVGKDGEQEVIYKITKVNGIIEKKEIDSEITISEPIPDIIIRGTK